MKLKFYGVRGSLPVPGKDTCEYGGNTTCIEVKTIRGDELIFDAGTGIRNLGNELVGRYNGKVEAKLFITHEHWDHIQGFPFFTPAYIPGCKIDVYSRAKNLEEKVASGNTAIMSKSEKSNYTKGIFSGQQDVRRGYFPIGIEKMGSELCFYDFKDYNISKNGVIIEYMPHSGHPGGMVSYRLYEGGKKVVMTGDFEHDGKTNFEYGENDRRMIEWAKGVDVLISDAQYTPEEYPSHKGWGHSQIERICEIAAEANVKSLIITHHDPAHSDFEMGKIERRAKEYMKNVIKKEIAVIFAREGMEIEV